MAKNWKKLIKILACSRRSCNCWAHLPFHTLRPLAADLTLANDMPLCECDKKQQTVVITFILIDTLFGQNVHSQIHNQFTCILEMNSVTVVKNRQENQNLAIKAYRFVVNLTLNELRRQFMAIIWSTHTSQLRVFPRLWGLVRKFSRYYASLLYTISPLCVASQKRSFNLKILERGKFVFYRHIIL